MSAIEVGEHNTKAPSQTWCRNIAIRSNYIENIGTDYFSSIGIMVTRIDTLNIEHNLLRHLPYSGITVGYGFNVDAGLIPVVSNIIRNNYIEDTMYALNDGGAIYTQGYITYRYNGDNIIENNYIKGNGSSREMSMGIYHDGSSSNWLVQNNVIDGYHRYPIFCQYHVQNQIASHINIINNYSTISPIKTEYQGGEERGLYFHNNTYYNDFSRLPESAIAIISNTGLLPEYRNIIDTDNGIAVKTYTTNLTLKPNAENELELIVSNCTNNQISGMFGLIFKKQIESDRGAYYIQSPEAPPDIKIIPESIQVTLMPNQKDVKVKFRITYELENNQSYNPSSYLVDLKLYANNGRVYSFPRITNLYMPSVFNDIPEVAFNESGNLFSNGSCSTSEGWAFWNPGTNNSVGYDEVDGNRCIKFTVSSFPSTRSTMYFTQNNISLKSNKKYRISFYMKASKEVKYIDNTQKILIRFYNNDNTDFTQNGKYIDFVCTDVNTLSEGEWYRIVGFMSTEGFNIPENSQFKIRFFIGGGSKTAEIVNLYFDNIITTEIE